MTKYSTFVHGTMYRCILNETLKYQLSCLLLKLEHRMLSLEGAQDLIENGLFDEDTDEEILDLALSNDKRELIEEIVYYLEDDIHISAYYVLLSDTIIHNQDLDLLKQMDKVQNFLKSKEATDGKRLVFQLDPFLNKTHSFIGWAWDELLLTRDGTLNNLASLEDDLKKVMKLLSRFDMEKQNPWDTKQLLAERLCKKMMKDRERENENE